MFSALNALNRIPPMIGVLGGALIAIGVLSDRLLIDLRNGWFVAIVAMFISASMVVGAISIYRGGLYAVHSGFVGFMDAFADGVRERGLIVECKNLLHALLAEFKNRSFSFVSFVNYAVLIISGALIFLGLAVFGIVAVIAMFIADCLSTEDGKAA